MKLAHGRHIHLGPIIYRGALYAVAVVEGFLLLDLWATSMAEWLYLDELRSWPMYAEAVGQGTMPEAWRLAATAGSALAVFLGGAWLLTRDDLDLVTWLWLAVVACALYARASLWGW